MTGIVSGCLASVASVFACCKLLGLSPVIYYSLIPKSITSSIAVSVSEEIGGISALTVALVVLTGLLGAAIASGMVKLLHLKNKVAIGPVSYTHLAMMVSATNLDSSSSSLAR